MLKDSFQFPQAGQSGQVAAGGNGEDDSGCSEKADRSDKALVSGESSIEIYAGR